MRLFSFLFVIMNRLQHITNIELCKISDIDTIKEGYDWKKRWASYTSKRAMMDSPHTLLGFMQQRNTRQTLSGRLTGGHGQEAHILEELHTFIPNNWAVRLWLKNSKEGKDSQFHVYTNLIVRKPSPPPQYQVHIYLCNFSLLVLLVYSRVKQSKSNSSSSELPFKSLNVDIMFLSLVHRKTSSFPSTSPHRS